MTETTAHGDIIAFIKTNGRIYDDKGIIVYKANGQATTALKRIFNVSYPRNPFTREPFRIPEDVVLKRVSYPTRANTNQRKRCGPLGCSIMGGGGGGGGYRRRKTQRRSVRSRRTRKNGIRRLRK